MKCQQCDIEFKPARKSRQFCSNECKVDSRRAQSPARCLTCSAVFSIANHRIDKAKYCSATCRVSGLTKAVTREAKLELWRKSVACGGADRCWLWKGPLIRLGYGLARIGRRYSLSSHRLTYELFVGPIPEGALICHKCDNRLCCNPHHLFPGSYADNAADMVAKHRQSKGEHRPTSKLTVDDVRSIRTSQLTQNRLAKRYGVSPTTINAVIVRRTWRHVE